MSDYKVIAQALNRLAAYEDSGLSPEMCAELAGIPTKRLLELVEADKEKRCVLFVSTEKAKQAAEDAFAEAFCEFVESPADEWFEEEEDDDDDELVLVAFRLSMPGVGSWNGKWTGEGRLYARVRELSRQKWQALQEHGTTFHYRWSDGWCAAVTVEEVDESKADELREKSNGFWSYDWMINSIIEKGVIETGGNQK